MKDFAGFLVAGILIFATTVSGQTPRHSPPTPPAPLSRTVPFDDSKTPRPDAGRIVGATYSNAYFGLQLTIPQGWTVHDEETNKKIMERGKEFAKAESAQQQAAYDASIQRTLTLLTITSGTTLSSSTTGFQCMAERLPAATTARDYVSSLKSLMLKSPVVELKRDLYTETIDGVEFAAIQTVMKYPKVALQQTYHVTIKKGFALGLIHTSADEGGAADLHKVMKSIRLTSLKP